MNNVIDSFYKEYFKYLPGNFDDIFILHANSGEIYCFLAYLAKACIKKSNSQNPLFVATKPYHTDIINLFFPKARSVYYDMYLKEPRLQSFDDCFEYDGHKIWQIFSARHFNQVNSNLGSIHYFDAMLNTLNINRNEVSKPSVKLPAQTKRDVLEKAEQINLDTDRFVILAPEALTTNLMPDLFWHNLVRELRKKDYDIFLNTTKPTNLNCKKCPLNLTELFALATYSKGIISLRSGISEFLIPTKTKNIILSPRFHWSPMLSAEQCIKAYSVMNLPFVDKKQVFEINPELFGAESLIVDKIISILEE